MSYASVDPVVEPEWLLERMDPSETTIVDCRFSNQGPSWGEAEYRQSHIPTAQYVHLNRDLADPPGRHGGRHPLPDPRRFEERMQALGVSSERPVVAYDTDMQTAARFWWLMTYFGHRHTHILNGGWEGWLKAGGPVSRQMEPIPPLGNFVARPNPEMVVQHADLLTDRPGRVLVDARSPERFRGESDPLDHPPGHIPGAIDRFWKETLAGDRFPEIGSLTERFGPVQKASEIVVYCGSGITACVNIAGMIRMGLQPKLYPGSWSDWITYPDAPIARGEGSER